MSGLFVIFFMTLAFAFLGALAERYGVDSRPGFADDRAPVAELTA